LFRKECPRAKFENKQASLQYTNFVEKFLTLSIGTEKKLLARHKTTPIENNLRPAPSLLVFPRRKERLEI